MSIHLKHLVSLVLKLLKDARTYINEIVLFEKWLNYLFKINYALAKC